MRHRAGGIKCKRANSRSKKRQIKWIKEVMRLRESNGRIAYYKENCGENVTPNVKAFVVKVEQTLNTLPRCTISSSVC